MSILAFTVPGTPRGKGRPRFTTIGGRARTYPDDKTVAYEARAMEAAGLTPYATPVGVDVLVVLPRPGRLSRKTDPAGLVVAGTKPDLDNVLKAVLDGCAPLWTGDQLVAEVWARKRYAEASGPGPRCEVRVWVL